MPITKSGKHLPYPKSMPKSMPKGMPPKGMKRMMSLQEMMMGKPTSHSAAKGKKKRMRK